MIVSVLDAPRGGVKFCLDTRNNRALPSDLAYLERLNVWSPANLPYLIIIARNPKALEISLK
jgi:hypothetical protein